MTEQWTKWEPLPNLAGRYYLASIADTITELKIFFYHADDKEKKVLISFNNSIITYEGTYETYRSKLICDLDDRYDTRFYADWTFFKVTNSSYIKWLSEQSCHTINSSILTHFAFFAGETILDIIALNEPQVIFINKSEGPPL